MRTLETHDVIITRWVCLLPDQKGALTLPKFLYCNICKQTESVCLLLKKCTSNALRRLSAKSAHIRQIYRKELVLLWRFKIWTGS